MSEHSNESLDPRQIDAIRQILAVRQLVVPSYATPVVGTAVMEDSQMRQLDERMESEPTEVVRNGNVLYPDWQETLKQLPDNPVIYETKYVLDSYYRFDTQISISAGTTTTLPLPNAVPNGKFAFLDEIHIAQLSGAGSSPNGFLTDSNQGQLYAIVTPDGSTFGASYKSGRNVIPGGVIPQLTLNALITNTIYMISVQYQIKTRVDMPQLDLREIFGKGKTAPEIWDEGSEVGDVARVERREWPGGPDDFSGWDGDA